MPEVGTLAMSVRVDVGRQGLEGGESVAEFVEHARESAENR